jgi:hypothetical protein
MVDPRWNQHFNYTKSFFSVSGCRWRKEEEEEDAEDQDR